MFYFILSRCFSLPFSLRFLQYPQKISICKLDKGVVSMVSHSNEPVKIIPMIKVIYKILIRKLPLDLILHFNFYVNIIFNFKLIYKR